MCSSAMAAARLAAHGRVCVAVSGAAGCVCFRATWPPPNCLPLLARCFACAQHKGIAALKVALTATAAAPSALQFAAAASQPLATVPCRCSILSMHSVAACRCQPAAAHRAQRGWRGAGRTEEHSSAVSIGGVAPAELWQGVRRGVVVVRHARVLGCMPRAAHYSSASVVHAACSIMTCTACMQAAGGLTGVPVNHSSVHA